MALRYPLFNARFTRLQSRSGYWATTLPTVSLAAFLAVCMYQGG
jgi:hypothetical protein